MRCKIGCGRVSPLLAAWREMKKMKMWIPMGAQVSEIIHVAAKTLQAMKAAHKKGNEILQKSA
jgi:hypothetical protein